MKAHGGNPLEGLVRKIVAGLGGGDRPAEEEILSAWELAAGRKAAAHSRPVSLKRAVLIVNCDGSGWLYELTVRKKEILEKLAGNMTGKKVKELRFRIGEIKRGENQR